MTLANFYPVITTLAGLALVACGEQQSPNDETTPVHDLEAIRNRNELVALCRYSSTGYFIYKGRSMGFEYELLNALAEDLGVELVIKVPRSMGELYSLLESGEGDIIAANLKVRLDPRPGLIYSDAHSTSRQVLVQRKPDDWRRLKWHELERHIIRNPLKLMGREVHVPMKSSYARRLRNLSEEIGGHIDIVEVNPDLGSDLLVKMVAKGAIEFTVADEYIAKGYEALYPILDAKTPISFPQRRAWAMREGSGDLLTAVNAWLDSVRSSRDGGYYNIYNKYFKNSRAFARRMASEYLASSTGKISPYDSLFIKYSQDSPWNWKLVASIAFQESRFDPTARSWAGAVGLMQVLPSTGRELGMIDLENPEISVRAGTKLLQLLYNYWEEIPDDWERIRFTLASYNAGGGHVQDARRLARKYGSDPNRWKGSVEDFIVKKSDRRYYYDEVVRYGYCQGEQTYKYVREILKRYSVYQNFEDGFPVDSAAVKLAGNS